MIKLVVERGIPLLQEKNIEPLFEEQTIIPDLGYNGLSKVVVNAIPDEYIIPSGELEITENGQYDITDKKEVNVNLPLDEKTITTNGTYKASDDNLQGYTKVNVKTSGVDINDYFLDEITGVSNIYSTLPYAKAITKLPAFKNTGTSCGYMFYCLTNLKELDLSNFDTSNCTDMQYMFYNLTNLKELDVSNFDTSNCTNLRCAFYYCKSLKQLDLSEWHTNKITSMEGIFNGCVSLVDLDISNITLSTSGFPNMDTAFYNCSSLKNINWGNFWTNSAERMSSTFYNCSSLESLPLINSENIIRLSNLTFWECTELKKLGGFKDIGKGYTQETANYSNYGLILLYSNNLTHDSLMNVINNLYDLNLTYDVANGGTLYTQQLVLGTTNMAKLSEEEIAIAAAKGWNVS